MTDFRFSIRLTVRIGDLNYGGHVGHQNYLLYFQEARLAYLRRFGFHEKDIAGAGMVVVQIGCTYKKELRHGDEIVVHCAVTGIRNKAFTMAYRIERDEQVCALGESTCVCLDRQTRKAIAVPPVFVEAVDRFEGLSLATDS